ncbi:MAG TPA: hypothetical protein VFU36_17735 [Jatrophihabitans sp.]|nr:hypothetical protein [Jatrophihabitans sp.]
MQSRFDGGRVVVGRLLRYRWMRGSIAGLVVAGVALAGCQSQRPGTAAANDQRPGSLLATVYWDGPVLLPDGRSIQVSADVMHLPDYCVGAGLPALRPTVSETATSVTIRVRAYRPDQAPPSADACAASGHEPVPVIARLRQPLGRRTLMDANGRSVPVLDAATVPTPHYLPAGYRQIALGGSPATGSFRNYERFPRPADGSELVLHIDQLRSPFHPLFEEQELARGTVLGHPARVVQSGGKVAVQRCVTWSDQPYVWSVCSFGGNLPDLSTAQLLRIANSLR